MTLARPIFTLGHSTRSLDELVRVLRAHDVHTVVDVRTVPRSRTNPQFNRDVMPASLAPFGIEYVHLAALGGLRGKRKDLVESPNAAWENASFRNYADYAMTPAFRAGLDQLLELAARSTTAILCAEAVWWRCHRRIIADHLLARGVAVTHAFDEHQSETATLTPFARVEGETITYPA